VSRLLLSFALALSAFAVDWTKLKPEGYVSDFAHVLDSGSRESIDRYLAAVEKASGAQIAIVTVDTLDREPIDDVANKLYRQFGVGQKGKNEGALFLLAVGDRKSRLEVGYGLEPIVPDGVAGDILRAMRPALRAQQYGPALIEATRVLGTKVAAGKNIAIAETLPARQFREGASDRQSPASNQRVVQILILVGVIALFALFNRRRGGGYGSGPWFIPGGGGFGGGGGGGGSSWGGFGGGDSGGGGASSDW
jgi:uncharacterized protein